MTSRDDLDHRLKATLHRNLIFVHGKGGVGKTTVSHAIARALAQTSPTLWITLEDPLQPSGNVTQISPTLSHLNANFNRAFEEYAALKIGIAPLTQLFLHNKLIRYLAQAAPGIHELVLLGKIWHERKNFSHVVVDLPSTGYGLAMFQSTENFMKLFHGGPLHRDADAMIATFQDPELTGHLIVGLPEEMPLQESIDLKDYLGGLFPQNAAVFLLNKRFPETVKSGIVKNDTLQTEYSEQPDLWPSPLAHSAQEYAVKRALLERFNLRIWRDAGITWGDLLYVPPSDTQDIVAEVQSQLLAKGLM